MGSKGRQRIRIGRRTRKGNRGRTQSRMDGKKSNEKSSEEPWKDGVGKVEVVVVIEKIGVGVGEWHVHNNRMGERLNR